MLKRKRKRKEIKLKECKVQSCPIQFQPMSSLQVACSPKCALIHTRAVNAKKADKEKKKREKLNSKELMDLNRRDKGWQHNLTQPRFNKMRVLEEMLWFQERNREPECISCGKTKMDFCCGHLKTVGSNGLLRYDPNNTWLQCNRYCNSGLSANLTGTRTTRGYYQGLRDRFGVDEGNGIIDYCETHNEPATWEWQDIAEIRTQCNARIREVERLLDN